MSTPDLGPAIMLPVSLRDYFAAQALPTVMTEASSVVRGTSLARVVEAAYAVADAMLAERAKRTKP